MTDFATKDEARREALRRRNELNDEVRATKSLVICESIMEDDQFTDARGIHVYLPIGSEVDIKPVISVAWGMGKDVGLMRVDADGGHMQFLITPETEYAPGPMGVLEPVNAERFDMYRCDLVLVPLVAVDLECNRIGYGKGYYDQFLTQFPRPTIGVAFDAQVYDHLPADELDIRLDRVFTETRILGGMAQPEEE